MQIEAKKEIRTAIADKRQRKPFIRQQRSRHPDINCGLQTQDGRTTKSK